VRDVLTDLKVSLRQLFKSPGFTITAVLTLALGIGATTAMFTLVYDVMLKPLPFAHPDQLVTIQEKVAEWSNIYPTLPVSANHFTFWQQHNRSFEAMAVMEQYPHLWGLERVRCRSACLVPHQGYLTSCRLGQGSADHLAIPKRGRDTNMLSC
jgi:hypothetical protein